MATNSLSRVEQFVEGFAGHSFWMGMDVHKRSYHIALLRADGKSLTLVAPASPQFVVQLINRLAISVAAVAYESGPTGFSLARELEAANIQVIVVAPSRVPRAITVGAKTDRLDCLKLAGYAAKGLLHSIAIPTPEEEARRSLLRRRHDVAASVRRCKQHIKSLLLFLGIEEPAGLENWAQGAEEALHDLPMEISAKHTLESHLRELMFYRQELKEVDRQLHQLAKQHINYKTIACLKSVPGVGSVVASSFLYELFRPERFKRSEEVASYLGLAPMVRHSGEKTPSGRLVPVGQTKLRSLLVEAAWMWQAKDEYARNLYKHFLGRMGIAQKAITALARKLAIILWRLCIEKRPYYTVTP
jgi:transposase